MSRNGSPRKTGLGSLETQLGGEHAAGHRPALLSVPAAPGYVYRVTWLKQQRFWPKQDDTFTDAY